MHAKNVYNSLIISLTSHPGRINNAHLAIKSLLNQTIYVDKVILWLGEDKFPNKENDLPKELLQLKEKGLTIEWCKDIGPYTKLIPALKKYPESIIVTADDDIIYEQDRLEKLYYTHLIHPKDIICHRAHIIKDNNNGNYSLFSEINNIARYKEASSRLFLTGVGMVLYPPKCFYKDIFRDDIFLKLANNNDDVWFWAMTVLNKREIRLPHNNYVNLKYIPGTQKDGLWKSVNISGESTNAFNRILEKYPQLKNIIKEDTKITEELHNYGKDNNIYAVSIIVPVYNMSEYLNRCLDSLINQTLKNIEIICINDGSTDNSPEILNEYAKKDNRIKVINQQNKKLSITRNVGIKAAKGEYIGFIDADDYIDSDFYEKLYKKAKNDNADIVRAPYYWVYPNGKKRPEPINKVIQEKAERNENLNFNEHSVIIWNAVYNTDFINSYNILFDTEDIKAEDIMFTARCQLFAQNIKSVGDTFYYYMQDNPNSTKTINITKLRSANIVYYKLVNLLNMGRLKKEFYNTEFKRGTWRLDNIFRDGLKVKDFNRKEKNKYLKNYCKTARLYKKDYGSFDKLFPYNSLYRYIYDGDIHSYKNAVYNKKRTFFEKYIFSTYMEYRKKDKHRIISLLGMKLKIKK
jgi:glycosyltransferase involved in cell wall biosynthesis